jgi:hypothetical protein
VIRRGGKVARQALDDNLQLPDMSLLTVERIRGMAVGRSSVEIEVGCTCLGKVLTDYLDPSPWNLVDQRFPLSAASRRRPVARCSRDHVDPHG